jgi:hypothetical protein
MTPTRPTTVRPVTTRGPTAAARSELAAERSTGAVKQSEAQRIAAARKARKKMAPPKDE